MDKLQIKELLDQLPDRIQMQLLITAAKPFGEDPGDPQDPYGPTAPPTRLIEVTEGESYKQVAYLNDSGKPVMKTAEPGWKTHEGERFLVHLEVQVGDGGSRWWKIWLGPAGIENQEDARGYYLNKEKTKKIT